MEITQTAIPEEPSEPEDLPRLKPKDMPRLAWVLMARAHRPAVRREGLAYFAACFEDNKSRYGKWFAKAWAYKQSIRSSYHRIPWPIRATIGIIRIVLR